MSVESEGDHPTTQPTVLVSLSGGGYRAAVFGVGALLAIADSPIRSSVTSISSVSGGSIASSLTIGGFEEPTTHTDVPASADPMGHRARLVAGICQTPAVFVENLLKFAKDVIPPFILLLALFRFAFPRTFDGYGWMDLYPMLMILFGVPLFVAITAIPTSRLAVQTMLEPLLTSLVDSSDPRVGVSMADLNGIGCASRVFCTTDVASGSHVYITARDVLLPQRRGRDPVLLLSDVVAASACFPGFRPIEFSESELGLSDTKRPRTAVRRTIGKGWLLSGLTLLLGLLAAGAVVARMAGRLPGWRGLVAALAAIAIAFIVGKLCWRGIIGTSAIRLVDGGVYDNYGASFTALTQDARYPTLAAVLGLRGAAPRIVIVVDASKVSGGWLRHGLLSLIPLRFQVLPRSAVAMTSAANGRARLAALSYLLSNTDGLTGAIVSIGNVPRAFKDQTDWTTVVNLNASTSTTLDALPSSAVQRLLVHAYRLTEEALDDLGFPIATPRTEEELMELSGEAARSAALGVLGSSPQGPYSRADRRQRRFFLFCLALIGLSLFVVPRL